MRRVLLLAALFVVAVAVVALAGGFSSSQTQARRPGPPLPASVVVGPRATLGSLRGQPAVINFWASWCTPCQREAPAFEAFARQIRGRARLVGINWNDSAGAARGFVRRYHWTFPNLRDGDGRVGNAYGIIGLPTTFILDAQGRIAKRLTGSQSLASVREALKGLPQS